MTKLRLEIELDYDMDIMHDDSDEGREWFHGIILHSPKGDLRLFSGEVGDDIGIITVTHLEAV